MKMEIPNHVKYIVNTLEASGYEAYIVGGCVRDVIRQVPPKDWDIATSATPTQAKALFQRTVDTGIKHGTITVLLDKQHYEVTTYRIDGQYLDNRRPETVSFTSDIQEDLSRRDFTMNAIAYNPSTGFQDPFGGREDIEKGMIRCVGNPLLRFGEDALRMLRAIRFAAVTGYALCPELVAAIEELSPNLQHISPERIREEMGKLLTAPHPQALESLGGTGLLPFILPYRGNLTQVASWLAQCPPKETMRTALFLHGNEWPTTDQTLRDLRYDNKFIKETLLYLGMLPTPFPRDAYGIKKILRHVPQDLFSHILCLKGIVAPGLVAALEEIGATAQAIHAAGECYTLKALKVNGKDIAALGVETGTHIGQVLEYLLDFVMANPQENDRDTLLALALGKVK